MRTASVRDLRYKFPEIEARLRAGGEIEITKRKKVIARLVPPKPAKKLKFPDYMAMLKEIYGDKVHKTTGAELIAQDRDRY
jgi:antitoxin (DNA-binding transcriptional repressor) of toxin-antitoxin stability system